MKLPQLISSTAFFSLAAGISALAGAEVKHIQTDKAAIAAGVWAGDTLYLSGQLGSPVSKGVYGDTKTQAMSALGKIKGLLEAQGLGMGDVVMMRVYMAGDPAMGGKLDFAGMNAAYTQFFGTADQPNKPARSAMQVAALAAPWGLVEIEVQAVRGSK